MRAHHLDRERARVLDQAALGWYVGQLRAHMDCDFFARW
jgi:hypothetical protein